jgi:drug/metabolite transporter (DMT)-like permease
VTRYLLGTSDVVMATGQIVTTLIFGAATAAFGWVTPTPVDLMLMMWLGITATLALVCVNRSLKLAPASVVVPYQYTLIVWAVIFGYAVFGDQPQPHTLIGAAIIVAAGLYIFWREQRVGAEKEAVVNPP